VIIDSSALMAVLNNEPEGAEFARIMDSGHSLKISAATYVEIAVIVDRLRDPVLSRKLDELIRDAEIGIEPLTEAQAYIARQAFRDFGKGSGHPAKLNFGDCFAYALAKSHNQPLLFKGDDFPHTDIKSARF
jgi:ribonuclease VapC